MLYLSNNGETCRDQLCQHPECWQSNVRRVREDVRQRNGIGQYQEVNRQSAGKTDGEKRQALEEMESFSLPTLKIIDMTEDLITPHNSTVDQIVDQEKLLHSPITHHLTRPACQSSTRAQVPRTTPISPSLPERHANLWKEKYDDYKNVDQVDEKMTKINFHEIYEYNEVCQDWQDTFISTAYLVWCPSKKKKRKKKRKTSSAVSEKRNGFKDLTEDVLPLPPESGKKKYSTSSKVPTGGQPYSPCRSPMSRMYSLRPGDYLSEGEFIMTLTTDDVPKSLMASKKIIERKPRTARKDEQLMGLKKSSSTKVLVDIAATLASPAEDKTLPVESQGESPEDPGQLSNREKSDEPRNRLLKQVSDFEPRKMLSLPSIAIPWGIIPERRRGHCKSSIPHCVNLDVMMEPVLYLPRSVSGSRSRVCANVGWKRESFKEEQRSGPSKESAEIRNHLTSAYRVSPKNVGTPAPTPATPRTRDGLRRRLSDLPRSYTKESLTRTRPGEESDTKQGSRASDGANSEQMPAVPSSRVQNDHALHEVAESNEGLVESIGNQFSKISLGRNDSETNSSLKNDEPQYRDLDKILDSDVSQSDRVVSASSRTNIPSDIWAELRSGSSFDHRRITPRSNLDSEIGERPSSLSRAYHSSLGLSIYSYPGETEWRPHPPRLPKSFTYMGVYKPTVLPKMPAALTVVPVPSVTRPSQVVEPRKVLSQVRSIRIPSVPKDSPVLNVNVEIPTASCTRIAPGSSTEEMCNKMRSLESLSQDQISTEKISKEVSQEREYLITREVLQETGEIISLDSENQNAGTTETLQDFVNSDKYCIEGALRVLEAITFETGESMQATAPNITCTEPVSTCTKPVVTCLKPSSTSLEGERSKDQITCTNNETTCTDNEITCTEDEATCTKDEIACTKDKTTYTTTDETVISKNEITKDEIIRSKDVTRGDIRDSADNSTCNDDEISCETCENSLTARDPIVAPEIDESGEKTITDTQINETKEGADDNGAPLIENDQTGPGATDDRLTEQNPQEPQRGKVFPGQNAQYYFVPKVPSDFELKPFSVESELLLPIKVDSDLLLLNDSFIDLSVGDDIGESDGNSEPVGDDINETE